MLIGELAKKTDCEVVTVRYYETEGLLPKPARNKKNYRIYDTFHIERLRFIRHCRSLDMTLDEIRFLLGIRDDPTQGCGKVSALLDAHIMEIETRVQALLELKEHLLDLQRNCSGQESIESCGILRELFSACIENE